MALAESTRENRVGRERVAHFLPTCPAYPLQVAAGQARVHVDENETEARRTLDGEVQRAAICEDYARMHSVRLKPNKQYVQNSYV